ncbi:glycosyltransferase family 52 [Neisseriaceae bacterium CLB008]
MRQPNITTKKNLIICMTPLQVLLAVRIIEQRPQETFVAIMITYFNNEKYRYYFEKLKSLCVTAHFFPILATKPLPRVLALYQLKCLVNTYNKQTFNSCFIASIDNTFAQLVASQANYHFLETFDDGTANLNYQGTYYQNQQPNLISRIIKHTLGIKLNTQVIRKLSQRHHTIYRNQKNITNNINVLLLAPEIENKKNDFTMPKKTINIFLGQPIIDLGLSPSQIITLCTQYKIDYYFPHPREKNTIDGLTYINTPLIFEDYILTLLTQKPESEVVLYHFISTAALNVIALPQVKAFSLYSPTLYRRFSGIYLLFQKNGMTLLEV